MLGSSQSIAEPNTVLNTIMAEELSRFADILENAEDFDAALHELVCAAFTKHQRILFGGNGYSEDWKKEAAERGLSNLSSTATALPAMIAPQNIDLVVRHGIYTETEFRARYAIHLEAYNKIVNIEARTMVDMAIHQILPAALRYTRDLCDTINAKAKIGLSCEAETAIANQLGEYTDRMYRAIEALKNALHTLPALPDAASMHHHDVVIPAMNTLRAAADMLESLTDKSYWPYPTYSDLMFY